MYPEDCVQSIIGSADWWIENKETTQSMLHKISGQDLEINDPGGDKKMNAFRCPDFEQEARDAHADRESVTGNQLN